MKRLLLLFTLCTFGTSSWAQLIKLSDDPAQFLADVQKMMATTTSVSAPKTTKNFEALWADTRLTATQQKSIIAISKRMVAKNYKPAVSNHIELFYAGLYAAYNGTHAAPEAVESFLTTATQVVESYDNKTTLKFFETAYNLFDKRLLYNANFNKLYALDGTYIFRFSDATTELIKTTETAQKATTTDDGWDKPLSDSTTLQAPVFYEKRKIPNPTGAIIEFTKNTNLVIQTANDSVPIVQTIGKLAIRDGIWVGTGGKISWEMADMPAAFVSLGIYSFNVGLPKIIADDAKLTYDTKLAQPIDGLFEYESKRRNKGELSPYPKFISYQNNAVVKSLSKNLQYQGGIALVAKQMMGKSLSQQPATIKVMRNGKIAFRTSSHQFEFKDSLITAPLATFAAYFGEGDSLYHAGIKLSYNDTEGVVKCLRADKTGYRYTPYIDSYHKMYVEAEMLRWNFQKDQIDFSMIAGKTEVPIRFESFHYFKSDRFRAISDRFGFHPLLMASNYMARQKVFHFAPEELATFNKRDINATRAAFQQLTQEGYFVVEPSNGLLKFSPKGVLNILAYNKQTDFDNFSVKSLYSANSATANADINLKTNLLTIRGIDNFVISDSLKIFAFPSDKELRVMKNRDFRMNGLLKSANFNFKGCDLVFNYDKFFVDLTKIDNITFTPKEAYEKGKNNEVGGDVVYEKSGRIYLNDPANKSGARKNSVFPRLTIPEGMTVYFDQPERGNIKYNRKVYFKIPTIDYDSLGMQDIVFIGTFYSDGILPPFQAELRSMSDNSLGFAFTPPANGYKVYGTNSTVKFSKEITMDFRGLQSQGEITHLTARIPTQSLLFTTDSLVATGTEAEIKEGTIGKGYFPKVDIKNFTLCWTPKADSMSIATKANSFNFYNATTKLEGRIILRAAGLYGKGFLRRDDSELTSQDIKFNKEGFFAGESQYKIIATKDNARPILLGQNVDVDFNIVKGIVGISTNNKSLETTSNLEFPSAAYRTSINKAQWNINAKTIAMKGDVATSTFTATAPEQQGLTFNGSAALYEIEKMTLNISGIPYIKTADAKVIPDKGLAFIHKNGEMTPFKNARLVLDTLNEYHRLKNANIQIVSRTKFTGDATYLYPTVTNDTIPVKMGNFDLRLANGEPIDKIRRTSTKNQANTKTLYTVASASIIEADNFVAAPRLQYKGTMTMLAPEPNLRFDGYVKPIIKRRADMQTSWIPFKETPTKDIALRVTPTLKNELEQPIMVGLHYRAGADGLYSTFLSPKEHRNDQTIFVAHGLMRFDEKAKSFKIMPEIQKGEELVEEENAFTFNDLKGTLSYNGKLNILDEEGTSDEQKIFLSSGSVQANVDSNSYKFNTLLSCNFPANKEIIAKLSDEMVKSNLDQQNSDAAEPDWERLGNKLGALIGRKLTDAYINRAATAYKPLSDASPKFNATLVLSNVNLRWSPQNNAFYSVGTIGVSNLGTTDINAQMEGMVEIRKNNRGDEITIYLESSEDIWYYFDWQQGKLAMLTSVIEINDFMTVKSKDKKDGNILVVGIEERDLFVDRFRSMYRPKVVKKPVVAKTPAKNVPANNKTAVKKAPEPVVEEEEAEETTKTVAKTATTKETKDSKTAQTTSAKSTDPKSKTDPKAKVAQAPAKPAPKKKEKEEEKEGF